MSVSTISIFFSSNIFFTFSRRGESGLSSSSFVSLSCSIFFCTSFFSCSVVSSFESGFSSCSFSGSLDSVSVFLAGSSFATISFILLLASSFEKRYHFQKISLFPLRLTSSAFAKSFIFLNATLNAGSDALSRIILCFLIMSNAFFSFSFNFS
jgi:hypothetical protein